MTEPPFDAYKVLQVDSEAEDEVIQAAYRRLAQKYHPDVTRSGTESGGRMASINRAWETLRDPARRRAYDRERLTKAQSPQAAGASQPSASSTGASGATSGRASRSSQGGGYDPAEMGAKEGLGAAGPPPGDPSGSVLVFGRFAGWSLGEVARRDLEYIEWLDRMPIGRPYREEIDAILRRTGRRKSASAQAQERRGLFRRR